MLEEDITVIGHLDAVAMARDQPRSGRLLELLDRLGDGRGRDADGRGGDDDLASLGGGDKIADLTDIEAHGLRPPLRCAVPELSAFPKS